MSFFCFVLGPFKYYQLNSFCRMGTIGFPILLSFHCYVEGVLLRTTDTAVRYFRRIHTSQGCKDRGRVLPDSHSFRQPSCPGPATHAVPTLQQYPFRVNPDAAPKGIFFKIVGCSPCASPELIRENIRVMLHSLHPDTIPTEHVRRYCPLLTQVKSVY